MSATPTEIHIYSIAVCPFAQRTRMLLALKGVPFDLTEIDITRPRPDWFLEMNPTGQVPVIRFRGQVLNESSVINEFLEEVFPTPRLMPFRPYERAQTRILVDRLNTAFVPAMYKLLMNQDPARHGELTEAALESWRWLDAFLRRHATSRQWLWHGFGLAEISAAPFFQRYCLLAHYRGFALPETAEFDRVRAWRDAALAQPLVQDTGMPDADFIKLYEDYALGYGNGAVPEGRARSSFDPAVPLEDRPLPAPPAWLSGTDGTAGPVAPPADRVVVSPGFAAPSPDRPLPAAPALPPIRGDEAGFIQAEAPPPPPAWDQPPPAPGWEQSPAPPAWDQPAPAPSGWDQPQQAAGLAPPPVADQPWQDAPPPPPQAEPGSLAIPAPPGEWPAPAPAWPPQDPPRNG